MVCFLDMKRARALRGIEAPAEMRAEFSSISKIYGLWVVLSYPCLLKAEILLPADNDMIQNSNAEYLCGLNKSNLSC